MRRFVVVWGVVFALACGRQESAMTPTADAQPVSVVDASHHGHPSESGEAAGSPPLATGVVHTKLAISALVAQPQGSPFGIATSHSSSQQLSPWLPAMREAGVTWLRGFDVSTAEARLTEAEQLNVNVAGILIWSSPGKILTLPADDLPGWSTHVSNLVARCKGRVGHWEVWNEPPNFTQDKSPEAYAKVVVAAYDAAKRVDPTVQIGIAAKSNHVQWLEAAIRAGAKDHFDYVTLHPYEVLDMVEKGGEALFLNIVPTLRKMLQVNNPERANAPVWFTELGTPVAGTTTPELQAARLLRAYTMGIAQGAARIHWFEGRDGDSGPFGLLDASGKKRPSYTALSHLIATVGATPNYVGWVTPSDGVYGFIFRTPTDVAMVAWASPAAARSLAFETEVTALNPTTGVRTRTRQTTVTTLPVLISGLPASWADQAASNLARPFPWGGDFSAATSVSLSAPDVEQGLHQFGDPTIRYFGATPARDASNRSGQNFAVDPNFATYLTGPLKITVVARRNGTYPAGFNLAYESTSGWKKTGFWYTIPPGDAVTTKEFTVTDAEFVGNWAYHFMLDSDSKANSQYSIQSVTVTKLPAN